MGCKGPLTLLWRCSIGRVYINNVGCKEMLSAEFDMELNRFILTTWDVKTANPIATITANRFILTTWDVKAAL